MQKDLDVNNGWHFVNFSFILLCVACGMRYAYVGVGKVRKKRTFVKVYGIGCHHWYLCSHFPLEEKRIFTFLSQIVSSPTDVILNWGVSNLYTVEHPKRDHLHFIRWKDNACTNLNLSEHSWRLNLFHSIILLKLERKWNPFEFKIVESVPIWFDFNSGLERSILGIWFY